MRKGHSTWLAHVRELEKGSIVNTQKKKKIEIDRIDDSVFAADFWISSDAVFTADFCIGSEAVFAADFLIVSDAVLAADFCIGSEAVLAADF